MNRAPFLSVGLLALSLVTPWSTAHAQGELAPVSREVVQPLPSPEVQQLNLSLRRLATSPQDLTAMIDAGNAALKLNDLDAARGFFSRAAEQSPGNSQAKMGLAAVLLRIEQPIEALQLFEEAERAGATLGEVHAERGLAYDLVGLNSQAQQSYRAALAIKPSDDVTRRLALSHAMAGDRANFEAVLRPLLDKRDFAAYRTRAFGLAILGDITDASAIAEAVMPRDLASHMTPYLAYMPRLTRAQQAAAANLGIFPRAAQIGRDDPRVASYAASVNAAVRGADNRLAPQGEPLDKGSSRRSAGRSSSDDRRRRPDRTGSRSSADNGAEASMATSESRLASVAQGQQADSTGARPEISTFNLASTGTQANAPTSQQRQSEARQSIDEAFSGFSEPSSAAEKPAAGAVDIGALKVRREVPPEKPKAKPEPPKHPSRVWVQVATGRDRAALRFDWNRMVKKVPDLLKKYDAHVVRWGQANRLLAGPLASEAEARALVKALKAKGQDSFTYTSPNGEEIVKIQ